MNMILYTGDLSSIRDSMYNMTYNYMRSHNYIIFKLAHELGCTNVLDGNAGMNNKIAPGSDVFYTLKEFDEFSLSSPTLKDYNDSIGVLFHTTINKSNYNRILKAISSSRYLIYYNSDPEFENGYNEFDGTMMLLAFIKKNPDDVLSRMFKSRCILILTGFHFMVEQLRVFNKPVIYIPQIINPNIPRLKSEKFYDVWMINTSPWHKKIADKFLDEGFKLLVLTRNKDWVNGCDYIECKSSGLNLDILINAVSLCKYYFGSYPSLESQDVTMNPRISMWNHTSKVLESYYANTFWITSNKNYRQCIDLIRSDTWRTNQSIFNKYIEKNFSFKSFKNEFKVLVDICNQFMK